eukprot:5663045-Pleurochrysis_carterae.AAC.1
MIPLSSRYESHITTTTRRKPARSQRKRTATARRKCARSRRKRTATARRTVQALALYHTKPVGSCVSPFRLR